MGSILEMLIVLVGAALLTVQGIKEDIAAKRQNLLQLEGQNMASVNAALGRVALRPGPFWGGTYQITMTIVPDNCSTSAGNCPISPRRFIRARC